MSKTVSTFVAVGTLGAGLVHLAVGAGAPLPLLAVFVAIGVAEAGWAVAILREERIPAPGPFLGVVLAPVAVWAAAVASGAAASLPTGPLAAASLLGGVSAALVAVARRRAGSRRQAGSHRAAESHRAAQSHRSDDEATAEHPDATTQRRDATTENPWRFIAALTVSAAIVAGIVTPALSGTWAGRFAEPHGTHGIPGLDIDEHEGH